MDTVETFLTTIQAIVTSVLGFMGDVVEFMVQNPVIIVPFLMFFVVGGVIGLVTRVMRA